MPVLIGPLPQQPAGPRRSDHAQLPATCGVAPQVEAQLALMLGGVPNDSGGALSSLRPPVSPRTLHDNLHLISKSFVRGRQEDAHELLRCLVDAMERDLLRCEARYNPHRPVRNPNTLVNQLFSGCLRSQVKCLACGHESNTYDPFMDLSLEVGGHCVSVEDALERFTTTEHLTGANRYRCDGCRQLVDAAKRMAVLDDPNILVVHLKRFDGALGKITADIAFGEKLDLGPYMCTPLPGGTRPSAASAPLTRSRDKGPSHYVLHGVLVHEGASANSGHYYSYIKDGASPPAARCWHTMDDSRVARVLPQTVLGAQRGAYILFYVRTQPKPLARVPEHEEHDAAPNASQAQAQPAIGPALPARAAAASTLKRVPPGDVENGGGAAPKRPRGSNGSSSECSSDGGSSGGSTPQANGGEAAGTAPPAGGTASEPRAAGVAPACRHAGEGAPDSAHQQVPNAAPASAVPSQRPALQEQHPPTQHRFMRSRKPHPGRTQQQRQQQQQQQQQQGVAPASAPEAVARAAVLDELRRSDWPVQVHSTIAGLKQQGKPFSEVVGDAHLRQQCRSQLPQEVKQAGLRALREALQ